MVEKDKSSLEDLVKQCIAVTSEQGKRVSQGGSLFFAWVAMQHVDKDVVYVLEQVYFPFSSGYCSLSVKERGIVVLEASGRYASVPYDLKVCTYRSGSWEECLLRNKV